VVKRLALLALAAWVVRWAVLEVAAYGARHWWHGTPPPLDPDRPPGHMPGPLD
jgi:hypothetical protein